MISLIFRRIVKFQLVRLIIVANITNINTIGHVDFLFRNGTIYSTLTISELISPEHSMALITVNPRFLFDHLGECLTISTDVVLAICTMILRKFITEATLS